MSTTTSSTHISRADDRRQWDLHRSTEGQAIGVFYSKLYCTGKHSRRMEGGETEYDDGDSVPGGA
ncbi:hypothetical protein ZHAS_00017562 [Anopheles sinensis]|uniref:Uncharacterized protein n=1 Tax=Anopheles sinensis TaxID=74873 RepID=A0A084WH61_ANOSI|nr:hypothetical protein ZHAS_00017562 [Anopheles sinensis]